MQEVREELWRGVEGEEEREAEGRWGRGRERPRVPAPQCQPSRVLSGVATLCPAGRPKAARLRTSQGRRERCA